MIGERGGLRAAPFLFRLFPFVQGAPISLGLASASYGDKLRRAIGTADPGAVPGGSTTFSGLSEDMTGPNQDRRVLKDVVFARAE